MNFSEIYNKIFREIPSVFPEVLVYVGRRTNLLKLKFKNLTKNALSYNIKFLQLKHWNADMLRPFLVGHRQTHSIHICVELRS